MSKKTKASTLVEQPGTMLQQQVEKQLDLIEQMSLEDSGKGFENCTVDSFAIPVLRILQAQSPECLAEDRDESVRPGYIYDNISKRAYKKLVVIPVHFQARYLEWIPRTAGGGLVAIHKEFPEGLRAADFGKTITADGHEIVDTRMHYVLFQDDLLNWNPAIISMSSASIKHSKIWMRQMADQRANVALPGGGVEQRRLSMFSRKYEINTFLDKNTKGSWYNWDTRPLLGDNIESWVYQEAKACYEAVMNSQKYDIEDSLSRAQETDNTDY